MHPETHADEIRLSGGAAVRSPSRRFPFRSSVIDLRRDPTPSGSRATDPTRSWVSSTYWMILLDLTCLALPAIWISDHRNALLVEAMLAVLILRAGDLYRPRLQAFALDELPSYIGRIVVAGGIVSTFSALRHQGASLVGLLDGSAEALLLACGGRILGNFAIRWARAHGLVAHSTLVVGSGPLAARLARTLSTTRRYGLHLVGYLANDPLLEVPVEDSTDLTGVPYLGVVSSLPGVISSTGAEVVLIADGGFSEQNLTALARTAIGSQCDLFLVPRLHEVARQNPATELIGAVPVVRFGHSPRYGMSWKCKRAFDLCVATAGLVLLAPVLVACAVATRLDSGPGILFRQTRVGRDGRYFEILKFRTMTASTEEADTTWNIRHDMRVTRVGRFLRKTSLDELPQLWNIVRGDMTVVGPRPERPFFVEKFTAEEPVYAFRHRVPSGLTGLAQVNGLRGDTSVAERSQFDNFYIENWSLWLDLKVIFRTVIEVLGARGG